MWGRFSDGLQRFQDKLDAVIDQTLAKSEDGVPQDGDDEPDTNMDGEASALQPNQEDEMERLKKSLDDADEQNRRINQDFQQILREKETEMENLKSKSDQQVKNLKQQFTRKVASFRDELSTRDKTIDEMKAELELAQEQAALVNRLQDEIEQLRSKKNEGDISQPDVDALRATVVDKDNELERMMSERERLDELVNNLKSEVRSLEERRRLTEEGNLNVEKVNRELRDRLEELNKAKVEAAELLREKSVLIEDAEKRYSAAVDELEQRRKREEQCDEEISRLSTEVDQLKDQSKAYQSSEEERRAAEVEVKAKFESEIEDLRRAMASTAEERQSALLENEKLKNEMKINALSLKEEVERKQEEIEELSKALASKLEEARKEWNSEMQAEVARTMEKQENETKRLLDEQAEKYEGKINKVKLQAKARIASLQKKHREQSGGSPGTQRQGSGDEIPAEGDTAEKNEPVSTAWQSQLQARIEHLNDMESRIVKEKEEMQQQQQETSSNLDKDDEYKEKCEKLDVENSELMELHGKMTKQHTQLLAQNKEMEEELDEMRKRLAALPRVEQRATEAESQILQIQAELDEYRKNLDAKSEECDRCRDEIELACGEKRELEAVIDRYKSDVREMTAEIQNSQATIEELKKTEQILTKTVEEKEVACERLQADLDETNREIAETAERDRSELAGQVTSLTAQLENEHKQNECVRLERDELRANAELAEERASQAERRLGDFETLMAERLDEWESERRRLGDELLAKENDVQCVREESVKISNVVTELKSEIEQLEVQKSSVEDETIKIKDLNTSFREESSALKKDLDSSELRVAELERELLQWKEDARKKLDESKSELAEAARLRASQTEELDKYRRKLTESEDERHSLQVTVDAVEEKNRGLSETLRDQQKQSDAAQREVGALRQKLIDIERSSVTTLNEQMTKASEKIALLTSQLGQSREREAQSSAALHAAANQRQQVEQQLNASINALQDQLAELSGRLREAQSEIVDERQATEEAERNALVQLHAKEELERELANVRRSYASLVEDDDVKTKDVQAKANFLESEVDELRTRLSRAESEKVEAVAHVRETLTSQEESARELEKLRGQLRDAGKSVEEASTEKGELLQKIEMLEKEGSSLQQLKGELEESLHVERAKLLEAQDAIQQLQRAGKPLLASTQSTDVLVDLDTSGGDEISDAVPWLANVKRNAARFLAAGGLSRSSTRLKAAAIYAITIHVLLVYLVVFA